MTARSGRVVPYVFLAPVLLIGLVFYAGPILL